MQNLRNSASINITQLKQGLGETIKNLGRDYNKSEIFKISGVINLCLVTKLIGTKPGIPDFARSN